MAGVPVGVESWTEGSGGTWERTIELDYLVGDERRHHRTVERCRAEGAGFSCPSGPVAAPRTADADRRAVASRPTGLPHDVLPALVIPAIVPAHRPSAQRYRVDGRAIEVIASDRLEIPRLDRETLDRWTSAAHAQASPAASPPWAAGGPCVQQAAALVALARAEGALAEVITGRVLRVGPLGPGLYPHAWAEVELQGRRWTVDPALGQVPTDALHLPLARGTAPPRLELSVALVPGP